MGIYQVPPAQRIDYAIAHVREEPNDRNAASELARTFITRFRALALLRRLLSARVVGALETSTQADKDCPINFASLRSSRRAHGAVGNRGGLIFFLYNQVLQRRFSDVGKLMPGYWGNICKGACNSFDLTFSLARPTSPMCSVEARPR